MARQGIPTAKLLVAVTLGCLSPSCSSSTEPADAGPPWSGDAEAAANDAGEGLQPVCATLATLAAGYQAASSVSWGDDPKLCSYIDCNFGGAGWEQRLFIGADGVFRLAMKFSYSGGRYLHLDGIARVTSCNTLVVEHLYDYNGSSPDNRGCDYISHLEKRDEVDSKLSSLTFKITLMSNGFLDLSLDALSWGGSTIWEHSSLVTATSVHTQVEPAFDAPLCDPISGRRCPPKAIGYPCASDAGCEVGTCSGGGWCTTFGCSSDASCDGGCRQGWNAVGTANYCIKNTSGSAECFPACPSAVSCASLYPGTSCKKDITTAAGARADVCSL